MPARAARGKEGAGLETVAGVCVFLFGLVFGSFLNVVVFRLPTGESSARGRSHCMCCGHGLRAADLVPVFSFVFLRGRCRYCGAKISPRYPLVELLTAGIWLAVWAVYGMGPAFALYAAFACALIVMAGIDADTHIIPNRLVLFILAVGAVCFLLPGRPVWWERLLGLAVTGVPLLLAAVLSHGGMGLGDFKLAAACGLVLGWKLGLTGLFFAIISAAVFGLVWAAATRRGLKSAIPFGPFLAGGFLFALLLGEPLLRWYLHLAAGL